MVNVKGAGQVRIRLRKVPEWALDEVRLAIRDTVAQQERRMKRGRFQGYPGVGSESGGKRKLYNRSGTLRNSIVSIYPRKGDKSPEGRSLVTAPYAALQEFGGQVTPTRGQFLRIPIGEGLTPSGVSRYDMVQRGRSWTTDDGHHTFIRNRVVYKVEHVGVSLPVPIAVLRRRVQVPARLGFFDTWNRLDRWRQIRFRQAIDSATRRTQ